MSEIDLFMEITSVEDRNIAENFMEMSGGDLESAVSLYYEHGSFLPGNSGSRSASNTANNINSIGETDQDIAERLQNSIYQEQDHEPRAPIAPTREQLIPSFGGFNPYGNGVGSGMSSTSASAMFGSSDSGIFGQRQPYTIDDDDDDLDQDESDDGHMPIMNSHNDVFGEDETYELMDEDNNYIGSGRRTRRRSGVGRNRSSNSVNRSIQQQQPQTATQRRLANLFRPPFDLIEKLDLESARAKARGLQKWIMVNIQDMSDFRCQMLNRDFWSNEDIKDIVRENFMFLQYHHDSVNGQHYSNLYPFSEYPHISILDPMTGERLKLWSGNPEIPKFIEQVVEFLDKFSLEKDKSHNNPLVKHKSKIDVNSLSEEKQLELAMRKSMNQGEDEDEDQDDVIIEGGRSIMDPIDLDSSGEESDVISLSSETVPVEPIPYTESTTDSSIDGKQEEPKTPTVDTAGTYQEVLALIEPVDHPDAPVDPTTTTRIQIRSGDDGKKIIKRFNLSDPIKVIYEVVKFNFEKAQSKEFVLTSQRENLYDSFDKTIGDTGLKNASILLEFSDA